MIAGLVLGALLSWVNRTAAATATDGERLARLLRYRAEVERSAYAETLRLCASYPGAKSSPPHAPESNFAWLHILARGLTQPLSLFSTRDHHGIKGLYNEVHRTRVWQFDAWLRSVHVVYLVNAAGFRRAAAECLGTTDRASIEAFAFSITAVDLIGSISTGQLMLEPINIALGWLLVRGMAFWGGRVTPYFARQVGRFATLTILPLGAFNVVNYLDDLRRARLESRPDELGGDPRRLARRNLMARAVIEFQRALDLNTMSLFETWARESISPDALRAAHRDLERMESAKRRRIDEEYRVILMTILPVLDQLDLN